MLPGEGAKAQKQKVPPRREVTGPAPEYRDNFNLRGLKSLPVTCGAAAGVEN